MPARSIVRRVVEVGMTGALLVTVSPSLHAQECVPQCRVGFVCAQGQCVSACNPPCAANQQCTADAQCIGPAAVPQAPPAASSPAPYGAPPAAPPYAGTPQGAPPPAAPAPNAGYNWSQPPAPVAPGPAPAEPEPSGKRARTHDGFYLQFALGVGYVSANAESQGSGGVELELTGVGQLGQLAIGGTVAPGLVLGGGIYGVNVFAGTYAYGPKDADFNETESDAEFSSASMIGPFVAYYFNPEQGAYLVGAPAYAVVSGGKSKDDRVPESSGSGFGLMLGAGYDAWVGDQWSVGALARFQYFSAELEDDDDNKVDFSAIVPGALFTVTYH